MFPFNTSMARGAVLGEDIAVAQIRATDPGGLFVDNPTQFTIETGVGVVGTRWHPGHYIKIQGDHADNDQNGYFAGALAEIAQNIDDIPEILGCFLNVSWGAMNPTGSTFFWDDIDLIVNDLAGRNKLLILSLAYKTSFEDTTNVLGPADLQGSNRSVGNEMYQNRSGRIMGVWKTSVMDRYIAAHQAIATRYDSNVVLEMVTGSESTPSWDGNPVSGYSNAMLSAELQRYYAAAASMYTLTSVAPQINSLSGEVNSLVEACFQNNIGTSDPDINVSPADAVFQGVGAIRNYRGTIPHHNIASSPALGGKDDQGPPDVLITTAQGLGTTHLSWVTTADAPNDWDANIKPAIQADPLLNIACPTQYQACDVS